MKVGDFDVIEDENCDGTVFFMSRRWLDHILSGEQVDGSTVKITNIEVPK